jgi:hypothetical protein
VLELTRLSQSRALTAHQVNAISKGGVHRIAPSLYMQIRDHGTRSWLFRYSRGGTALGGIAHRTPKTESSAGNQELLAQASPVRPSTSIDPSTPAHALMPAPDRDLMDGQA